MGQKRRMRLPHLLPLILLLQGCGDAPAEPGQTSATIRDPRLPEEVRIECAVDGAAAFARSCILEQAQGPDGLTLTVRAPSGSFRRLLVVKDGRGVIAADGADAAQVTPVAGNRIEVAIAGDRYRLPATVRK
jgi:hypothetical protein